MGVDDERGLGMIGGEGGLDIGLGEIDAGSTETSAEDLGDLAGPGRVGIGVEGSRDIEEERGPGGLSSGGLLKDKDTLDGGGEGLEEVALGPGAVEVDLEEADVVAVVGAEDVVE